MLICVWFIESLCFHFCVCLELFSLYLPMWWWWIIIDALYFYATRSSDVVKGVVPISSTTDLFDMPKGPGLMSGHFFSIVFVTIYIFYLKRFIWSLLFVFFVAWWQRPLFKSSEEGTVAGSLWRKGVLHKMRNKRRKNMLDERNWSCMCWKTWQRTSLC